ncbi:MAG: hypothetical protein C0467_27465 [Planctomycetaceae bacterium]|nr:hypothetical protein [Planctomycetaceae bacterium]
MIDSRTLSAVKNAAKCHLIPECFGVSNKTIRLDRSLDNAVGRHCDSQLHTYFQYLIGDELDVRFALDNGSKSLAGTFNPRTNQFWIPKPEGGAPADWVRRALGMRNNQVRIRDCVTRPVNMRGARMSMVNSAMLILQYLQRSEVLGPGFKTARKLLDLVHKGKLDSADLAEVEELTPSLGVVSFDSSKLQGITNLDLANFREYYDPTWNPGDNLLEDFPKNCVAQDADYLFVRIPYGNCLRGTAKFPLIAAA